MAVWTRSKTKAMTRIGNLSSDLFICILLRLPIKSLLICLSVCKTFHQIIKSQEFIHLHFKHPQKDYYFIYHYPHKKGPDPLTKPYIATKYSENHYSFNDPTLSTISYAESPLADSSNALRLPLGCCKGLVCLQSYDSNVYFWNPATKMCKTVKGLYRESPTSFYSMVFGYGFVSRTNEFKLIRMKRNLGGASVGKIPHEIDVYTLSSNSWRRINNNVSGTVEFIYPTACVNGVVYWHAAVRSDGTTEIYNFILGFNLDEEVFHEIALPENLLEFIIYEYKECLCISSFGDDVTGIWLKKDQGTTADSWVKLHTFAGNISFIGKYGPQLLKNDELLVPQAGGTFLICDPKNGEIKKRLPALKNVQFPENDAFYCEVWNYTESLVLLKQGEIIPNDRRMASVKKRSGEQKPQKQPKKVKRSH